MSNLSYLLAGLILSAGAIADAQLDDRYPYAFFNLPTLGGQSAAAYGINQFGHVAGAAFLVQFDFHATIWQATVATDLGTLGGTDSQAVDANGSGWIAGWSNPKGQSGFDRRGVLWRDGEMIELGDLGGKQVEAYAINESGWIVGKSDLYPDRGVPYQAFLWQDGVMTNLGALAPEANSVAWNINAHGDVVGQSAGGAGRAVLWTEGQIIDLGTLGDDEWNRSYAYGINDLGYVVGNADVDTINPSRAFIWFEGRMYDLGKAQGTKSLTAYAINNLGQVVGSATTFGPENVGIFWQQDTGMLKLDTLLPPRCPWRTKWGWDINDAGQISGTGYVNADPDNNVPFLMSPVYPTMTVSQPTPGLAGEVNTLTLSNCTPGTRVYLTYSPRGGGTIIPGCDIQENALQLENPKVAGSVVADANGEGVFTFFVPDAARNLGDILIQAVVPGECAVSNLVVEGFE